MGTSYMSDVEEEPGESLFDGFTLDVQLNMESPPAEVFETSWIRAKELLDAAGPHGAILLLTIREDGEDLASSVVLSSGAQQLPTNYILEILDAHLEALREE